MAGNTKPDVLVTDPTNNNFIWFTEQHGGRLDRFNITTKQIDQFNLSFPGVPQTSPWTVSM